MSQVGYICHCHCHNIMWHIEESRRMMLYIIYDKLLYIWLITFRISKLYTDHALEVYKVDLPGLGTLLSSLVLT